MIARLLLCVACAGPVAAQDVWVLGEVHDNPAHHATQAAMIADIAPAALVLEMLDPGQAAAALPALRGDRDALADALGWAGSGWPDFELYYPIFAAAPDIPIYGAHVPRAAARSALAGDVAVVFGEEAATFGLNDPLEKDEQSAREALQLEAHCDALPAHMLAGMVTIQRLRDAALARVTRQAHRDTGGPVVVITGNGHARTDWGMPSLLTRAAPELDIVALGQGEEGTPPPGTFDRLRDAPAPERTDPCDAFR